MRTSSATVDGGMRVRTTGAAAAEKKKNNRVGDFELAANALGVCDAACESALQYARTPAPRRTSPLSTQQIIQLKLNEMYMLTEALRSLVMRTAWEMDNTSGKRA